MELKNVVIIGAGTMGKSIAQWFAQQSVKTQISDENDHQLDNARIDIEKSWKLLTGKGVFTEEQVKNFKKCISYKSIREINHNSTLIIEAIVENLEIKTSLFKLLDGACPSTTIFASNTSSLSINQIAAHLSTERKSKFLGLHFFNPATIMKLVEVINGEYTNKKISLFLYNWFDDKGKKPALCEDGPGFIVNRVARNFYGEAMRVVDPKTQNFAEIDQIMREVGGFKMGPFELMDLIGIDINYAVTKSVWSSFFHDPRFAPHSIQRKLVECGRLGRKTKRGFYEYE